jgi:hypothetical protein
MMEFDIRWVNVQDHVAAGVQPVFMYERPAIGHAGTVSRGGVPRQGEFYTVVSHVLGETAELALCKTGDHVRIPILAYRTSDRAHAAVWGMGVQVGMGAAAALYASRRVVPVSCVLVLGHELTDLPGANAYRCYVGVSFRTG